MTAEPNPDIPDLLDPVAESFGRVIRHFGPMHRGVGWRSPDGHRLRFQILSEIFATEADLGHIIVNDLGCGYGAYFDFLKDLPAFAGGHYLGYDISPHMLDACRKRIKDPTASFIQSHRATETADYSFVCGSYNIKMHADDAEWLALIEHSLMDLWSMTKTGLAFNMMSNYKPPREPTIYYADPKHFFDFCMKNLSDKVTLLHDYSLPEWSIFILRG